MLVQELLNSVGDDMDQLPLLQHALMRTWAKWQGDESAHRPISVEDLHQVGGMAEALSKHAEESFASLASEREKTVAERVFKRLTEKGPDNRELRRPTKLSRLERIVGATREDIVTVIHHFRAKERSFLLPPLEVELDGDSVIDISHESLIRQWGRLRDWVADESDSRATYERLLNAARLHKANKGALWREPDLIYAREWYQRLNPTTDWADQYGGELAVVVGFLKESENAWATEVSEKREAARAKQRELEQARALADEQRQRADERALAKQRELEQSQKLAIEQRQRADDQSAARAKQRILSIGLFVLLVTALIAAGIALKLRSAAVQSANEAISQGKIAAESAVKASEQATRADENAKKAEDQAKLADERRAALQKVLAAIPDPAARQALSEQFLPDASRQLSADETRAKVEAERIRATEGTKATARVEDRGLKLWTNGSRLRIRFLDGDSRVQDRVLRVAREWAQHANVQFAAVADADAEIRISFKEPGVWSFMGTDALGLPADKPSVNFGWLTQDTDERELRRAVLHEFGHVLGLVHEYQNPNADIPWNKTAVRKLMSGPPNYWDRAAIEMNLFGKAKIPAASYREYDAKSIMVLGAFDKSFFTRPFAIEQNDELSESDKSFIAKLYPRR